MKDADVIRKIDGREMRLVEKTPYLSLTGEL